MIVYNDILSGKTKVSPYQNCLLAILNPSLSCKVGGLCTVESMVETSMIGVWESHHELTSLLSNLRKCS